MTHIPYETLILYVYNELEESKLNETEKHLSTCSSCQKNLSEIQKTKEKLNSVQFEFSPEDRLIKQIQISAKEAHKKWFFKKFNTKFELFQLKWAVASLIIILGLATILYFRSARKESSYLDLDEGIILLAELEEIEQQAQEITDINSLTLGKEELSFFEVDYELESLERLNEF